MVGHPITWVMVADGARARVFVKEGAKKGLTELPDGNFAGSRQSSRELGGDRPGRTFDSAGPGRHAMEPPSDPHKLAETDFVRSLTEWLSEQEKRNAFERLVLIAAPRALGELRRLLPDNVARHVDGEIAADLVSADVQEIEARLPRPPLR